jgi:hypothetical protein
MRFTNKKKNKYRVYQTRVVKKFLWWPKRIGHSTRWFEWAEIKQTCVFSKGNLRWIDLVWIDK